MNSLSRKHFLRLALAVVAVAAAGSAPNVFAAEDIVEITVAHPYGKIFRPIHQKIIKEFNKIHPNVKVRLETPFPDYEELTQRTLAGIAQGNAPVLSSRASIRFANILKWVRPTIFRSSSKTIRAGRTAAATIPR